MSIREQIEGEKENLQRLCQQIGVPGLRVHLDADSWDDVTFIGNIDISRMEGYARRFFDLEQGLLRIFHRRVHLVEEEIFQKLNERRRSEDAVPAQDIELLHAS